MREPLTWYDANEHNITARELLLHPECEPWTAHSDIWQARSRPIICTSKSAVDAYLKFGSEEAKSLVLQHRAAVLAIAEL